MEITFSERDLEAIATKVAANLLPLLKERRSEADTILTVDGAAMFLSVSKGQIYQWTNLSQHGLSDFPFMKAGRLLRFSKNELFIWLKNKDLSRNMVRK